MLPLSCCVSFGTTLLLLVVVLLQDLMSHLEGEWQLEQVAAAAPLTPAVTKVTYTFEMWPKGGWQVFQPWAWWFVHTLAGHECCKPQAYMPLL